MKFNELPMETQEDVRNTLCAYDECFVKQDLETGKFSVSTCVILTTHYTTRTVMRIHKDDIYTKDEQIVNYVNEFKSYPYPLYKGREDYRKLRLLDDNKHKAILVDGNIEIVEL